ncbi:CwfJ C-terminus 1-domain-containing protein-like protein [Mycena olivaceomarginata]|nr:CwfJ C-terminus 1-domain-containing protein-like protein [Mycena olivaceomarginata]
MPGPRGVGLSSAWEAAETKEMEDVVKLYGKTYHLWQTDRGDALPLGKPELMMSFTREGEFDFEGRVGRGTQGLRQFPQTQEIQKARVVDDDPDDDLWVEKNIDMDGERPLATTIPTGESLKLTSTVTVYGRDGSTLKRDDWMLLPPSEPPPSGDDSYTEDYGETSQNQRTLGGGVDFFSSLGTDIKKKPRTDQPDPNKASSLYAGGPGSQWRMMRLKRVYETAEEEGLSIEQVAVDRFGSLAVFEEAKEERRILDEREGRRSDRDRGQGDRGRDRDHDGEKRFMFTDVGGSGASSRSSSFRRPGGYGDSRESGPSTPSPASNNPPRPTAASTRSASPLGQQSHTPIPSVITPPIGASKTIGRALSPSSLNRLQAKVLRAKLMGAADADALEREYEAESRKALNGGGEEGGVRRKVEVLPTLDGQGRLYDVGHGAEEEQLRGPGNRKKTEKFETHDPKTGEILRYNANDDTTTLGEMLRQERFGGGMADQKNMDAEFARSIMSDGKFQNDLEYIDENAEKLGRQKMRSDAMKRQFAVHVLFGEDDSPPKCPVVAMGTRAYLACTTNEELVPGHCLIVPIQHHLNMLEADDEVWDEVRNFMKCLMRMFAEEDKGVIFYETVISLKWQKHTVIECVPLPWDHYEDIPQYFKESILASEAEWSQHKKVIDFARRPGGFRRAMVPNLPYFMVQFDHKGERGYGHEGEKGGGEFPRYFAGEIIGNVLELEPRKWRRPKRIDFRRQQGAGGGVQEEVRQVCDWTGMIGQE